MVYKIDGCKYDVVIIKKKNKNTYIRFKEDMKIYVTTNYLVSNSFIAKLLDENVDTIRNMIDQVKRNQEKKEYFNYLGNRYDVFIDEVSEIKFLDDAIFVPSEDYLNKWLKAQIKNLFQERLDYNYRIFKKDIPYPKLKIRNMKTRWGVCNIRDNSVTLNSRLIEFDLEKLDYVIIHELSHFVHFNHSQEFWNLVSEYIPNYKEIRKEMRE